ncbi:MAG: phosphotransferase [Steroidobacteraceae bacterium]|jgi:aminoglycoside/choline kinase family phosphotransferase
MSLPATGDLRLAALNRWVVDDLGFADGRIEPASADASFRRYFRLTRDACSYIIMDAPPDKEDLGPFVQVAEMLAGIGLSVPLVLARHVSDGLLLLTDLGSRQYLDELVAAGADAPGADALYGDALDALATMQTAGRAAAGLLPAYGAPLLIKEMELMPEWFLRRHLGIELDAGLRAMLKRLFETLAAAALSQPVTFVHRDYHSRNLMLLADGNPGIIDFQDAVAGPVTYDLVSLLKDCYIAWPASRVRSWALQYREQLLRAGFEFDASEAQFLRWFDLMGLQRHIKVLGIFCRLFYRDGKSQYLRDLPRVLAYAETAAAAYSETEEFAEFLARRVRPLFDRAQARALA